MNNIEQPVDAPVSNALNDSDNPDLKLVEVEAPTTQVTLQKQQHIVNLSMPRNAQLGSHTWSTRRRVFDNPKPMRQVIRHSTTNRSQPLGLTESPPQQRKSPRSPPKAHKPPSNQATHARTNTQKHVRTKERTYQTTEKQPTRVPPRPKMLPELEEEEDYDFSDGSLARPRAKRADDYYEEIGPPSTTQTTRQQRPTATKMNCLQYLGNI